MPVAYLRLEQHIRWCRLRNLSATTIRDRRNTLMRLGQFMGHAPFSATADEIRQWQEQLAVGPATRAGYFSHVAAYFAWLVETGLRDDNPATALIRPRLPRCLPRPISTDDLLRAVRDAPPRVRPWLVLAAWAGLRCVEIALLRRECVFDRAPEPYILVAATATKGGSEHVVPMCPTVVAELTPLLPRSGWVFPRADGKAGPNLPAHLSAVGNAYLHEIGIPETMHSLRHWFGTTVLDGSGNLRVVQELMGHRSVQSTQIYTKVRDSSKTAAVNVLPVI